MRTFSCLLLVAACGSGEPEVAGNAVAFGGTMTSCPPAYCGSNSATIDHYNFHELNLDGARNAEGFRVLGMSSGSEFYKLDVVDSRIIGRGGRTVCCTPNIISGYALKDAVIYLEHTSHTQYAIRIAEVSYVQEIVAPYDWLETYHLEWAAILNDQLPGPVRAGDELPIPGFDGPQDICPFTEDKVENPAEWNEAARVPLAHALVYEGDRIDRHNRTVNPVPDRRWFNLTCGADTLTKLRLSRSTLLTTPTKADWRLAQATLKMLSADYCGTGTSFTMRGEPLIWTSLSGMQLRGSAQSFEARWDENGARCLDEPRARQTDLPDLAAMFPKLDYSIEVECINRPLKPCQNPDPYVFEPDDLVISANPY